MRKADIGDILLLVRAILRADYVQACVLAVARMAGDILSDTCGSAPKGRLKQLVGRSTGRPSVGGSHFGLFRAKVFHDLDVVSHHVRRDFPFVQALGHLDP